VLVVFGGSQSLLPIFKLRLNGGRGVPEGTRRLIGFASPYLRAGLASGAR